MIGIYAIFRKSDDKCMYVGESRNIEQRIYHHLTGNSHINVCADTHYGKPIEIHETNNKKYRLEREIYWISVLNPELNQIRDGSSWMKGRHAANRGKHHSEETRKKLSILNKGSNNPMYGRPSSNRGKPAWNKGKKFNKETRKYE